MTKKKRATLHLKKFKFFEKFQNFFQKNQKFRPKKAILYGISIMCISDFFVC